MQVILLYDERLLEFLEENESSEYRGKGRYDNQDGGRSAQKGNQDDGGTGSSQGDDGYEEEFYCCNDLFHDLTPFVLRCSM